jgi:hypothetical protein
MPQNIIVDLKLAIAMARINHPSAALNMKRSQLYRPLVILLILPSTISFLTHDLEGGTALARTGGNSMTRPCRTKENVHS